MLSFKITTGGNHKTCNCVFDKPHLNKIIYYKISKIEYSKDGVVFCDRSSLIQIIQITEIACLFVLFHLLLTGAGTFNQRNFN